MGTESTVGPITLLLGIPADREEFLSRAPASDWLAKFYDTDEDRIAREHTLEARWLDEYGPLVAEPLQELIGIANRLCVPVHRAAELDTLREATASNQVVILFAHWKGPEIRIEDFVLPNEPNLFENRVQTTQSVLAHWLGSRFSEMGRSQCLLRRFWKKKLSRSGHNSALTVQDVRDALNEALRAGIPEVTQGVDVEGILEHETSRSARRREEMDVMFLGLLRPGNRLELFDGLHSKEEAEESIAQGFQGVLDLTTCTSTVLADYISRRRRQRLRTVQFATVQEFVWCAKVVGTALELVVTRKVTYLKARLAAAAAVGESVKQLAAKRR